MKLAGRYPNAKVLHISDSGPTECQMRGRLPREYRTHAGGFAATAHTIRHASCHETPLRANTRRHNVHRYYAPNFTHCQDLFCATFRGPLTTLREMCYSQPSAPAHAERRGGRRSVDCACQRWRQNRKSPHRRPGRFSLSADERPAVNSCRDLGPAWTLTAAESWSSRSVSHTSTKERLPQRRSRRRSLRQ